MTAPRPLTLWRLTWSHCTGVHWLAMRLCDADSAARWLAIYEADEPSATFTLARRRPALPDNAPALARHAATFA